MTAPTSVTSPLKLLILKAVPPLLLCPLACVLLVPCVLLVDLSSAASDPALSVLPSAGGVVVVPVPVLDSLSYYLKVGTLPVCTLSRCKSQRYPRFP